MPRLCTCVIVRPINLHLWLDSPITLSIIVTTLGTYDNRCVLGISYTPIEMLDRIPYFLHEDCPALYAATLVLEIE
jgi:hypothetical protein